MSAVCRVCVCSNTDHHTFISFLSLAALRACVRLQEHTIFGSESVCTAIGDDGDVESLEMANALHKMVFILFVCSALLQLMPIPFTLLMSAPTMKWPACTQSIVVYGEIECVFWMLSPHPLSSHSTMLHYHAEIRGIICSRLMRESIDSRAFWIV